MYELPESISIKMCPACLNVRRKVWFYSNPDKAHLEELIGELQLYIKETYSVEERSLIKQFLTQSLDELGE